MHLCSTTLQGANVATLQLFVELFYTNRDVPGRSRAVIPDGCPPLKVVDFDNGLCASSCDATLCASIRVLQLIKRWSEPFRKQQPSETPSSSSSSSTSPSLSSSSLSSSLSSPWSSSSSLTRSSPTAPPVAGMPSRGQLGAPLHGTLTPKPKPSGQEHMVGVVVATGASSRGAAVGMPAAVKREWVDPNPREAGAKRGVGVYMASVEGVTAGPHSAFGKPDNFSPKDETSGYVIPKRSRFSGGVDEGGRSNTAAVSVPVAVVPSR